MYNGFTEKEKIATLLTCAFIANADNVFNGSEYAFFSILTIQMDAEEILKNARMTQEEGFEIIRKMSIEKKEEVKRAWMKMWSFHSGGQYSGYFTLDHDRPEDRVIKTMAIECDINVSGRIYIDDLSF